MTQKQLHIYRMIKRHLAGMYPDVHNFVKNSDIEHKYLPNAKKVGMMATYTR